MSYLSDLEHMKLDATVYPDRVIQRQYISDTNRGQRRVLKTKVWNTERILGTGTFGEVRLEKCHDTNERRAVKRILSTGSVFKTSYERELKALLEFSKPKYRESAVFVDFLGWFEDVQCIYLAMEYMSLGDLEDNVKALGGTIGEAEVRDIAIQVLEGLRIMHLEKFAHRDLKPKNILICQGPPRWWVKLADFGLSKRRTEESAYKTQMGTFGYMAPEILNYLPGINSGASKYTNAVDIWALGCIVFRLATGAVPFPLGPSLGKYCGDETAFPSKPSKLSEVGYGFVRELLVAQPAQRLTAEQALGHAWTKADVEAFCPIGDPVEDGQKSQTNSADSFGGYNTATHAGLQSYQPSSLASRLGHSTAKPKAAGISYHAPTVEDEEEEIRLEDFGVERKEVEDNVSVTESDHEGTSDSSIYCESDSDLSDQARASVAAEARRVRRSRSPSLASWPTAPPLPWNQRSRKNVQPDNDRGRERESSSPETSARAQSWRRPRSTDSSKAVDGSASGSDNGLATNNFRARFERSITPPRRAPEHNSNKTVHYEDGLFDRSPNTLTRPYLNDSQARRLHYRFDLDRLPQYGGPMPSRQQTPLEAPLPFYDPFQEPTMYSVQDWRTHPAAGRDNGQLGTSGERPTYYADERGFIDYNLLPPRIYQDISSPQSTASPASDDRSRRRNQRPLTPPSRPIVLTARRKLPREGSSSPRGQPYYV